MTFKVRSGMLEVKDNYKHKYRNRNCRLCNNQDEDQVHVLQECLDLYMTKLYGYISQYYKIQQYAYKQDHVERTKHLMTYRLGYSSSRGELPSNLGMYSKINSLL